MFNGFVLTLLSFFVVVPAARAEYFIFRIPSSFTLQAGNSDQESEFLSAGGTLTFGRNWIVSGFFERSEMPSAKNTDMRIDSSGMELALSSDPLKDLSCRVSADGSEVSEDVKTLGGRIAGTWARKKWMWTLELGAHQITFEDLPPRWWNDESAESTETSLSLSADWFLTKRISLRASHTVRGYDKDMSQFAPQALRILLIPGEVITSVTVLNDEESSVGIAYARGRFGTSLMAHTAETAIENLRNTGATLAADYRVFRRVTLGLQGSRVQSEDSEEDPIHSGSLSVTSTF